MRQLTLPFLFIFFAFPFQSNSKCFLTRFCSRFSASGLCRSFNGFVNGTVPCVQNGYKKTWCCPLEQRTWIESAGGHIKITNGSNAVLPCKLKSDVSNSVIWKRFFNGENSKNFSEFLFIKDFQNKIQQFSRFELVNDNTLIIKNVTKHDTNYKYVCVADQLHEEQIEYTLELDNLNNINPLNDVYELVSSYFSQLFDS